ncbi:5'/3'-nucleotidase SurE [Calderihabitans maritimus]|uniref:5'-nucleotidase SurE n=1 Tax=Calderihabitans maritimus TaxID=1246530 RepID=A0A1Z5HY14_9FIRM|nr:5'/3'-nucleotidase SurE [Calderihabitans maritimus]GAW94231.1 stationary-phase survival protein SurE [Calderihabitans maritimus]
MRILLTNDDGIWAEGINQLRRSLEEIAEVWVVAPDRERSATGHGITVHKPLRVEEINFPDSSSRGWAVTGTPADCVKLALEALLEDTPEMVVSGINWGANLGTDVLYSGTVSAAFEGVLAGIPSVAVSLTTESKEPHFEFAARFTRQLCLRLAERRLNPDTLLNVNIPDLPPSKIKGVKITKLGVRRYKNAVEKRKDPRGRAYYWLAGEANDVLSDSDTDIAAIKENFISVTPVHFDLTNYAILEQVRSWGITPEG